MKRFGVLLGLILILVLVIPLISCSDDDTNEPVFPDSTTGTQESSETSSATSSQSASSSTPLLSDSLSANSISSIVSEQLADNWTLYSGPELEGVKHIRCDSKGRLWFGTNNRGLTMYDGHNWYNWQPAENSNMRENRFTSLAISGNDVHGGSSTLRETSGVMLLDTAQNRWTNLWPAESELSAAVTSIASNSAGAVYFATDQGIIDIDDNGVWQHIQATPLPSDWVEDSLIDSIGNYFVATDCEGIWVYDGSDWLAYDPDSYFAYECGHVNRILMDDKNQLWVAAESGLYVIRVNGEMEQYCSCDGYCEFWDIAFDSDGQIWGITNNVLYAFDGMRWNAYDPVFIKVASRDRAICIDSHDRIWISVDSDGVAMFEPNLLIAMASP